jgi:hypothetical protein
LARHRPDGAPPKFMEDPIIMKTTGLTRLAAILLPLTLAACQTPTQGGFTEQDRAMLQSTSNSAAAAQRASEAAAAAAKRSEDNATRSAAAAEGAAKEAKDAAERIDRMMRRQMRK